MCVLVKSKRGNVHRYKFSIMKAEFELDDVMKATAAIFGIFSFQQRETNIV